MEIYILEIKYDSSDTTVLYSYKLELLALREFERLVKSGGCTVKFHISRVKE